MGKLTGEEGRGGTVVDSVEGEELFRLGEVRIGGVGWGWGACHCRGGSVLVGGLSVYLMHIISEPVLRLWWGWRG
jgi:hypothetical protein